MGLSEGDQQKLQKQVVFYFSDQNIMGDNFLLGQVKSNEKGWVPLTVLATFKAVQAITTDIPEIAAALGGNDFLELDEEKKQVRRTTPLPEKWEPIPRTLYAKGFPEDEPREAIAEFFSQFGTVYKVMKRYYGKGSDKKAKTSVYIEFSAVEELEKALNAKPEYKDVKLEVMTKQDHVKELKGGDKKRKREEGAGDEDAPAAKAQTVTLPEGTSMKFTEVGEIEWTKVKDAVKQTALPRFCVVQEGTACVMFSSKEDMEKVAAKHKETPLTFGEAEAKVTPKECVVLDGEEEKKFRETMETKINAAKASGKAKGGKGGKKGKGKKGGKGGKGKGKKN
eukprot:TRINITY_DN269_c0_g2_i1.p1 TRINITY_DN269_c0_g2~~TRINITY_DN269_c0_g2_i1.p1  ORF type:complete len:353 (+),score=160.37 TRINITY_DN269_c0_g2_i1:50-1060(+)